MSKRREAFAERSEPFASNAAKDQLVFVAVSHHDV
jgi:hypothetical protein